MKQITLGIFALTLTLLSQMGCGSSAGDANGQLGAGNESECTFKISDFTNGPTAPEATSQWNCSASNGRSGAFQFYDDGTGFVTTVGAFTWSQTSCNSLDVTSSAGTESIININGSIASGVLVFEEKINGQTFTASCFLETY